ncbi:MAG: asparagine synthetase B family protein [Methanofollis sp.]|uniref:asparagine synthase-related protein n=1 Tax=Methanofollis sp. TaxID=2052835 RepID=UPI002610BB4B|nr:asparagine synthetase B family protein [Methanofollis sp.]MDD4255234.1 asparagine synthetase B family protein [Methanofollis sp.]
MTGDVCLNNPFFPWEFHGTGESRCWYKGTVFAGGTLLDGRETATLLLSAPWDDPDRIRTLLESLNGEYAFVVETPDTLAAAVDRLRSIPLFSAGTGEGLTVADDPHLLVERLSPPLSQESSAEFLAAGFVTGPLTLYRGIRQLQVGECLISPRRSGAATTVSYAQFRHGDFFADGDLTGSLDDVFLRVFRRLLASCEGRRIVVPLSGGLDSRIIVAMLRRLGVEDVTCFSYGVKESREVRISREVARALGYDWHYVEYTKEKVRACYRGDALKEYLRYGGNLSSLPHTQDYLAVCEMREEGVVPPGAVFVPGHSGDMLAGSHIPREYGRPQRYTLEKFLADTLAKHYSLWAWDDPALLALYSERILMSAGCPDVHDAGSCADAIEYFDFKERQAKFIINAVRVYEYFGHGWRVPLWDRELMWFFQRVPLPLRLGQALYKDYAARVLFTGDLAALGAIECTTRISDAMPGPPLVARVRALHHHLFDPRWGRYFAVPPLSRLYLLRMRDAGCLGALPRRVVVNSGNARHPYVPLVGYQALRYLSLCSDQRRPSFFRQTTPNS